MKKYITTCLLAAGFLTGLTLNGCAAPSNLPEENTIETAASKFSDESTEDTQSGLSDESAFENTQSKFPDEGTPKNTQSEPPGEMTESADAPAENTHVVQGGPYGEISLSIPDGWRYDTYPMDNGQLMVGLYGIRFYPEEVSDGYIELAYADQFGVCGTGLSEEQTAVAGHTADIGTYDNQAHWDFITFHDDYNGVVALTYYVDDWWETYNGQVMDILDTLSFDPATREGGAYIYSAESENSKIGLSFMLKNISPTGATLMFRCYDADAPTGELQYGSDYTLEVLKNDAWEEVPVTFEDNYAFNALAFMIPSEGTSEQKLEWEWLYGALEPGTYRIQKSIMDFRESGDYNKYTVYAQFILN